MNVLMTGASGFIGRRVLAALQQRGHGVVAIARKAPVRNAETTSTRWVALDLADATTPGAWLPLLGDVDAVVNLAGLFRETRSASFETVHHAAPAALFEACRQAGVRRVVQLSALSGTPPGRSRFIDSKRAADAVLLRLLPQAGVVARPSLVFGPDGASSRMMLALASLPLLVLPRAAGEVQPVHVDDAVAALVALIEVPSLPADRTLALVGPQAMDLPDYIGALASAMQRRAPAVLMLPRSATRLAARVGTRWFDAESLALLDGGAVADPAAVTALLGRAPRPASAFVAPADRDGVAARAVLDWAAPMLRIALALVWIVTGIVSVAVYPVPDSLALLGAVGVPRALQPLLLCGAAAFDLLLGLLTLFAPGRWLWRAQALLMLFYTAVLTLRLPEFWAHPFGPLLKNLPILAALVLLDALASREGRGRAA